MSRSIFRLLVISLIFVSCKEEKKNPEVVEAPLEFEKEIIQKKAGAHCDTADYDCSVISLEVVKATGAGKISEIINEELKEHLIHLVSSEENDSISTLDGLAENFLADYRRAAEDFSEEPPWEAYVNENIYLRTESLISVGITTEIFSGGAHGYKNLSFLNFDPKTGRSYSVNELFTPDFKKFVEGKFREEQGIPANASINSTGFWFEDEVFNLPQNIGFSEDQLILVYNSYEIAPYAAGDIYMEIPIEQVRPFLKIK